MGAFIAFAERFFTNGHSEGDPLGTGFQVNASRDAIISRGFWGKGIGEGTRKIASIPEIQSDFIFSAYVEETGFWHSVFLRVVYDIYGSGI